MDASEEGHTFSRHYSSSTMQEGCIVPKYKVKLRK